MRRDTDSCVLTACLIACVALSEACWLEALAPLRAAVRAAIAIGELRKEGAEIGPICSGSAPDHLKQQQGRATQDTNESG